MLFFIGSVTIDFGRAGSTSCPPLSTDTGPTLTPWVPANIVAGTDITTFNATMGQAGGVRGYEGITGNVLFLCFIRYRVGNVWS